MTILFCADQYLPAVNGITLHISIVKNELEKRGHTVIIATGSASKKKSKNVDIITLPATYFPGRQEDLITLPYTRLAEQELLLREIDIVHDHLFLTSVLGAKIARKKNIPHLVTYHTMFTYLVKRMLPVFPTVTTTFISNLVSRIYFHQFDLVLAPSHKAVTSLHDSGSKTKVKLHYNGIPLSHFANATPTAFRKKYHLSEQTPLIIIAGRIDSGKQVPLAVEAFALLHTKLPNVKLAIIGDGVERKKVEKKIASFHLEEHCILTGLISQEMLASANKASTVALFTSLVDTLSTTAIEQATAGLPFVAVKDPGVTDIARHNENALLTSSNPQEIADALFTLLTDETLKKKFRNRSKVIATEFTIEACVDGLMKIYQQEIDKKRLASRS